MSGPTLVGRAIGGVVNPVIHNVDVDDIVQRIDWNALVDKIDLDRVLDRVDIDRILDRVDVDKLVARSNLDEIVARSSSGVFTAIVDAFRAQGIRADQLVHGWGHLRCLCPLLCRTRPPFYLPPKPGFYETRKERIVQTSWGASELALATQGRAAGVISRAFASLIDWGIGVLLLTVAAFVISVVHDILDTAEEAEKWSKSSGGKILVPVIAYLLFASYTAIFLAVLGRTVGHMVMGLIVLSSDGDRLSIFQALLWAFSSPNIIFLFVSSTWGWVAPGRRHLLDFLTCSAVVHKWSTRSIKWREESLSRHARATDQVFGNFDSEV